MSGVLLANKCRAAYCCSVMLLRIGMQYLSVVDVTVTLEARHSLASVWLVVVMMAL